MATLREGNQMVLLVVDVQIGVMRQAWEALRIIKNISLAVEKARSRGIPVIWVQHADIEAATVVRELNVAMAWLNYPGRKNRTVSAEAFDFAAR